jgi:hypothetical protein
MLVPPLVFYICFLTIIIIVLHCQQQIPVYLRWGGQPTLKPMFFTTATEEVYFEKPGSDSIQLQKTMCCQRTLQKTNLNYGETPTVSAAAVRDFKRAAYSMLAVRRGGGGGGGSDAKAAAVVSNRTVPTHFEAGAPLRILLSYRGPTASRHLDNIPQVRGLLFVCLLACCFCCCLLFVVCCLLFVVFLFVCLLGL